MCDNVSKRSNTPTPPNPKKKRACTIKNPVVDEYEMNELEYYKKLSSAEKKKVAETETRIIELNDEKIPIRFKILQSQLDEKIKAIAIQKLNLLYGLEDSSTEYFQNMHWLENVCKLPIGKYKKLPIDSSSSQNDIKVFLQLMRDKLDTAVFGHQDVKDQIVRLLAQWISNPTAKGMVIGLQSPPGCAKTTIAQAICKALEMPFAFISLAGISDEAYLRGHSVTYIGSIWGKLVDILMKNQYMNNVLFFDELDKISSGWRGDMLHQKFQLEI